MLRTIPRRRSAAGGCSNLGLMYANGRGVPEDDVQAYAWFSIVAAQGNEKAKKYKGIIEKKMTRSQVAEAQKLARECVEKNYKGVAQL